MSRDLVIKQEGRYRIEENRNYAPCEGNLFLILDHDIWGRTPTAKGDCIGAVDQLYNDDWEASIFVPEKEDGSDAVSVYSGASREEAIEALWQHRYGVTSDED